MKGKIYNILLHARQVYNDYNVNIRIARNYKNRLSVMFGDIEASLAQNKWRQTTQHCIEHTLQNERNY